MTAIRLVSPARPRSEPAPDPSQAEALATILSGAPRVAVLGAAGTGTSTVAVAAVADAVKAGMDPDRVLLLAPTRVAAATLRDRVSVAVGRAMGEPVARTAASLAFAIISRRALALDEPRPALITGAEQDVMLRELLDGHRRGDGHPADWSGVLPADATALPGFRGELRNLLMRAFEADIDPAALADLGSRTGRPEWVAAAQVMGDYEDAALMPSFSGQEGARYDSSAVVSAAAAALDGWEDLVDGAAPSWDLVVVDDFQDGTIATARLVAALHGRGARIALVGNADESVQGYRGASATAMLGALAASGDVVRCDLTVNHRQSPQLRALAARTVERIGVVAGCSARAGVREPTPGPDLDGVTVLTAPHRYGQSRAIASHLRRARHGLDGPAVPWANMAVIARSGAQLRALRSDLLAADIPCEVLGDGTALHREPAVRPLLQLVEAALGDWDAPSASEVLESRIGGLDPVSMRRLRRALVKEERAAGGERSSDDLLVEALADPARLAAIPGPEARAAARVASAAQAARERAGEPGPTPGAVLWAAWESLDLAAAWRDAAIAGSDRDDADLDAVIALMRAAQTFSERLPRATLAAFLASLESQEFAADTLGARAQGADAVAFATPASAAGREWDLVVIAGVEEGVWPDLRIRDSVLGAQTLADHVLGRASAHGQTDLRSARAAVLDDETRAFLVAVSRARTRLLVTAVDDGESRPSRFVTLVESATGVTRVEAATRRHVADLRGAVAWLRREGAQALADAADARLDGAAQMLARLATLGVAGANPSDWHGVPEPSTDLGFWDADATIRVSPSKFDAVRTCGLRWALESVGGTPESSFAQSLGTLVHEIAAELPAGTESELMAALDERWTSIGGTETWMQRREYQDAREMLARFARYASAATADEVMVEQRFGVEQGRARISGSADRVEITDGEARIVDLKTGAVVSRADAAEHGQLMLYQLATHLGGFPGVTRAVGAALVFLSSGRDGAVRTQDAVDPARAIEELDAAVETMASATFDATPNPMCERCPIRRSCPAHAAGDQVTDS